MRYEEEESWAQRCTNGIGDRGNSNIRLSCRYKGNPSWQSLCSVQFRELYALGTIQNDLYITGGQMKLKNQYCITNCVEKYSMEQDNWRTVRPLPVPLACHAVVTLKNRLYVMGGWTPQVRNILEHSHSIHLGALWPDCQSLCTLGSCVHWKRMLSICSPVFELQEGGPAPLAFAVAPLATVFREMWLKCGGTMVGVAWGTKK